SVGPQAVIEAGAQLGADVIVGPGCVISAGVIIDEQCHLIANVTVCSGTRMGKRVLIHPGAVIGSDGFGLANDEGKWVKIPQLGGVVIADDVEIGANTTIDKGALEDTFIDQGVKLDNQIQIGHNVQIGAYTAIAGCVGIAGSTRIGRYCMIAGGVGIVGHIELVDNVHVTGGSIVLQSITEPGTYSSGTPLEPNRRWRRTYHRLKKLDEMARHLQHLEQTIK
ncbi:MAG: UDP-3-O-(3-hydroxymyristoyl)glucosamine N-acyltransferase, partial [Pseudomonadota bacterium]|nr:UDP-3-O-(3-hydroxymyristoyl)glucosamine N-acyltransferase [Pseudomonadota bacterium]